MHALYHRRRRPPRVRAWLALGLPLLGWLIQVFVIRFDHNTPAEVYLLTLGTQGLLTLGGGALGIWVLVNRRHGDVDVLAPAIIGLLVSGGTLVLIVWMILAA